MVKDRWRATYVDLDGKITRVSPRVGDRGLYVVPFSGLAFIWSMAAPRDRYVRSEGKKNVLLSTVHLISGTLFVSAVWEAPRSPRSTDDTSSSSDHLCAASVRPGRQRRH